MKINSKNKTETTTPVSAKTVAAAAVAKSGDKSGKPAASPKKKAVKKVKGTLELNRLQAKRDAIIDSIRERLLYQKQQLLSEAGATLNTMPSNVTFPDLSDQASAEIDRNFSIRLLEREQKLLKKIDGALEKITSGSYGLCETCGEEIGVGRLHARPVTSMCIDCKTEQEEEEKLREG
jgi:DnaK suppressor protein